MKFSSLGTGSGFAAGSNRRVKGFASRGFTGLGFCVWLKPQYVDNAVAALRLSSLPTLVWFRGGSQDLLGELAQLADRVVLDEIDPLASWKQSLTLLDRTAFSDLRWARLTRWRTLMAHFFDIPRVRHVARSFTSHQGGRQSKRCGWETRTAP